MKKLLIATGFLAGFTALGWGLSVWYKGQMSKVMQYCYKIKRYKITRLDTEKIQLAIDLLIRNNSAFSMDINGYDLSVYVNDIKIAILKDTITQTVRNNSLSLITLNVDVIAKNLFKDAKKLGQIILYAVVDRAKFIIKVEGNVSASSGFLKIKQLPINISMNLDEITTDSPDSEKCTVV